MFKNNVAQIPSLTATGELAAMVNPGGFEVGGNRGLFADKHLPSIQNNLSKVWGTHTVKGGVLLGVHHQQPAGEWFHERPAWLRRGQSAIVRQSVRGSAAGTHQQLPGAELQPAEQHRLSTRSSSSCRMRGRSLGDCRSILVSEPLTSSHGRTAKDLALPCSTIANTVPGSAPADYSGFSWNKRDPNVPLGGFPSRALFWAPRFGLAFDIFGTGNTVLRGGWGRFYFHTPQFTAGSGRLGRCSERHHQRRQYFCRTSRIECSGNASRGSGGRPEQRSGLHIRIAIASPSPSARRSAACSRRVMSAISRRIC